MALIEFNNKPDTTTPINATNLNNNFNELDENIGELNDLSTIDKTNTVNAINEIFNNSIIESGSNENGKYIKLSDGTMIQWQRKNMNINTNTSWSGLYYGTAMCDNFPIPFVGDIPTVLGVVYPNSSTWCFGNLVQVTSRPQSLTYPGDIMVVRPTSTQDISVIVEIIAVGKWK